MLYKSPERFEGKGINVSVKTTRAYEERAERMGTRRHARAENGAEKSIPRAHEAQFGQISRRADQMIAWRNDLPIIVHNRASTVGRDS